MSYNFATYAEYIRLTEPFVRLNTLVIPDNMTYPQAALLEPLASVVHGHKLLQIRPGERIAILGAGGAVGLMHLQLAKASGASELFAVDLIDERLEYSRLLGATMTIQAKSVDPISVIRDATNGRGVDVVIECAGSKQTWEMASENRS